jgi:hypothetical protein
VLLANGTEATPAYDAGETNKCRPETFVHIGDLAVDQSTDEDVGGITYHTR